MGCAEIVDGALRIVSLGYISSQLSFHFVAWHSIREMNAYIAAKEATK
jgi:hypothetical protein